MQLLIEAGLPPGVINFLLGMAQMWVTLPLHTHSSAAFTSQVQQVLFSIYGKNRRQHRLLPKLPRVVGETGGKDFILAHPSADVDSLSPAIVRGAFEYQGQKCSAASRIYVPRSLWPSIKSKVTDIMSELKQGDVRDFGNFTSAVIDERAFVKHSDYLSIAHASAKVIHGGKARWFGWLVHRTHLGSSRRPQTSSDG